jgi:hypothetical protein
MLTDSVSWTSALFQLYCPRIAKKTRSNIVIAFLLWLFHARIKTQEVASNRVHPHAAESLAWAGLSEKTEDTS